MSKLYEIAADYRGLIEMVDSGDFTADDIADTLEGIKAEIDDKIQSTVCVIREMESEAKKFDDEIARMTNLKKSYTNTATRLKDYIRAEMSSCGIDKSKGLFSVSLGNPSVVTEIVNSDLIPAQYQKTVISMDKSLISKDLKAGKEIQGAKLADGARRLTIR